MLAHLVGVAIVRLVVPAHLWPHCRLSSHCQALPSACVGSASCACVISATDEELEVLSDDGGCVLAHARVQLTKRQLTQVVRDPSDAPVSASTR